MNAQKEIDIAEPKFTTIYNLTSNNDKQVAQSSCDIIHQHTQISGNFYMQSEPDNLDMKDGF